MGLMEPLPQQVLHQFLQLVLQQRISMQSTVNHQRRQLFKKAFKMATKFQYLVFIVRFLPVSSVAIILLFVVSVKQAAAQVTNNSSSLTNQAAPSASSVTTGGTNVNYQTNNQWSNEIGFGPGIFCRTPTFYVGGSVGTSLNNSNTQNYGDSGNYGQNISGNVGILLPFGSSTLRDCQRMSAQIVRDRQISTELSMIRACKSLQNEGIKVDPEKYPLLSLCVESSPTVTMVEPTQKGLQIQTTTSKQQQTTKPNPAALHDPSIKSTITEVNPATKNNTKSINYNIKSNPYTINKKTTH